MEVDEIGKVSKIEDQNDQKTVAHYSTFHQRLPTNRWFQPIQVPNPLAGRPVDPPAGTREHGLSTGHVICRCFSKFS